MVYTAALPLEHGLSALSEDGSVVEMIGRFFQPRAPVRGASSARRGSVDSCDEKENNSPGPDQDSGLEEEQQLLHHDVTQQMERCLTEAKASTLHCRLLLLPRRMIPRIGQHILRSSAEEPCGLRGASIKLYVEGKDGLKSAGSILPDPSVTPTFELSVVLRVDEDDGWPPLRHIFDTSRVLKLRAEYRLVKRKLYSSASPVVQDYR
ncbi:DNA damage-inducible transcript 4-like protein [Kryptolebias marmoratus]|uniref:DNA damage-inducible transcript 4-like protein n=1 Tax=Kryptolebias marmoratus TaxID=37003 RepID=A0A3Q3ASI3_KRYMA|nr:DNA damage-inducible transcript 4-like protein [Kryptolebias marmoratus]